MQPEWPAPPAGTEWSDWDIREAPDYTPERATELAASLRADLLSAGFVVLPFYCDRCGYRECRRCQGCYCADQPRTCDACDDGEEQR